MNKLLDMLEYMRPQDSVTQRAFCSKYLEPVFGECDIHGNYLCSIAKPDGTYSRTLFTAHHDTVHSKGGMQEIFISDTNFATSNGDCLGADCTTGIWLILEMIAAKVPGIYIIHASEEIGCLGSSAFVRDNEDLIGANFDAVISFDRKGTNSIVTHQMSRRTCSEAFATSLGDILGMNHEPDDGGSYTDSNEYIEIVQECTNLSVGYYSQHTRNERQDLTYVAKLRDALIAADWSQLVIERDPKVIEYASWYNPSKYRYISPYGFDTKPDYDAFDYHYGDDDDYNTDVTYDQTVQDIINLLIDYPHSVATILSEYGHTAEQLIDDLGLDDYIPPPQVANR